MRNSWFALESNKQRVEDLTAAVQFNIETRDAYVEQFDVAQRTLLDVLDAENELFVSRGQLVTAEINEILAGYRILALGGQLLATLAISAPEQAVVEHKSWNEAVGLSLD
jgi:adhesin transport system outer membrane protein